MASRRPGGADRRRLYALTLGRTARRRPKPTLLVGVTPQSTAWPTPAGCSSTPNEFVFYAIDMMASTDVQLLWQAGGGLGGIALAPPAQTATACSPPQPAGPSPRTHSAPRAKRVVQLFMSGAASQCDTFDYKPRARSSGTARSSTPARRSSCSRSDPGDVHGQPLGVAAVRPVRQVGQRPACRTWRRASTTSPSSTRWSPSRTSTARRRSCRTPASSCPASPAWARGSATAWAA